MQVFTSITSTGNVASINKTSSAVTSTNIASTGNAASINKTSSAATATSSSIGQLSNVRGYFNSTLSTSTAYQSTSNGTVTSSNTAQLTTSSSPTSSSSAQISVNSWGNNTATASTSLNSAASASELHSTKTDFTSELETVTCTKTKCKKPSATPAESASKATIKSTQSGRAGVSSQSKPTTATANLTEVATSSSMPSIVTTVNQEGSAANLKISKGFTMLFGLFFLLF